MAGESQGATAGGLRPLSLRDLRMLRGGLALFISSEAVPFIVMINVRYVMTQGYTPPGVPVGLGIVTTLLMLVSIVTAWQALGAARQGNTSAVFGKLGLTIALALLGLVGVLAQMGNSPVSSVSHYGETYLSTLGVAAFFLITGLVVLFAGHSHAKRLGVTPGNNWSIELAVKYWIFNVIAWLALFLDIYFL